MYERATTKAEKKEKYLNNQFQWNVAVVWWEIQIFLPCLFFDKSSLLKENHNFWLQSNLKGQKWGSSFDSVSWIDAKRSLVQLCPCPLLVVGHPVPATGTCHWLWGWFVGGTILLSKSSGFLKWGFFPSSFLPYTLHKESLCLPVMSLLLRC